MILTMAKFIVKSFNYALWIASAVLLFSACRRWQYTRKITPVAPTKKYTLTVAGVECKQCALQVLSLLEKSKHVKSAQCHCRAKQYESAYFTCLVSAQGIIALQQLARALAKQEFILQTVAGGFRGMLSLDEHEHLQFTPEQCQDAYIIKAPAQIFAEIKERVKVKPSAQLSGILNIQTKQFTVIDNS